MYRHCMKRFFDIILSVFGILISCLPMLIIALAIKIDSPGPVIFKQKRLGYKGKEYEIWKFRSMCVNAEQKGSGVYSGKGDTRVTRVGKIIRKTSLDEIPQLFNIFVGNMSFVGPRPPLTYHPWTLEKYTDKQLHMFDVRPGITGWAQINGRKEVEWNRRIEMNVWYVDHMSFMLDLKIMWLTIWKVIFNEGNENTKATVVETDILEKKEKENK